jgi:hypothetical protein
MKVIAITDGQFRVKHLSPRPDSMSIRPHRIDFIDKDLTRWRDRGGRVTALKA